MDAWKYRDSDSQTLVNVDSKLTAYNLKTLPFTDPNDDIGEGIFLALDATSKKGRRATNADGLAMISYFNTLTTTSKDFQQDAVGDGTKVPIEAGGLSGIVGAGLLIGIPTSVWDTAATPAIGDYVGVGASGKPLSIPVGSITGKIIFGYIYDIDGGGRVRICFSALGTRY